MSDLERKGTETEASAAADERVAEGTVLSGRTVPGEVELWYFGHPAGKAAGRRDADGPQRPGT